jgi:hypothetical protein
MHLHFRLFNEGEYSYMKRGLFRLASCRLGNKGASPATSHSLSPLILVPLKSGAQGEERATLLTQLSTLVLDGMLFDSIRSMLVVFGVVFRLCLQRFGNCDRLT